MVSAALPGRAQTTDGGRFAFADTTLLRDTLGLRFTRLLPLADSLGIRADTLRALSVRNRVDPDRLVFLSDSMRVPVDSVAVVLLRERFNPFANQVDRATDFTYTSSYNIQETSNSWSNNSDFNFVRGPLFVRNISVISLDRYRSGKNFTRRQSRNANTEVGWRLTPGISLGGRAVLDRFDSNDPSNPVNVGDRRDDFQFSGRSQQTPSRDLATELNVFTGLLRQSGSTLEKTGLTAESNGRLTYRRGNWLSHDLRGEIKGNVARTRDPSVTLTQRTYDLSRSLRGGLQLFQSAPVGMVANFGLRSLRVESPEGDTTRLVLNSAVDGDATVRLRRGNDRYLNLTSNLGVSNASTASFIGRSRRTTRTLGADGRYGILGWVLDGRFTNGWNKSDSPRITATGGYVEDAENRSLDGTLNRQITRKLSGQLQAGIGLARNRYTVVGEYPGVPVPRDQYRQNYKIDGIYTFSTRFNSGVGLEVIRNVLVNISATSSGANTLTRTYGADWRWTYRLMQGLTATQRNSMRANYLSYTYLLGQDRLSLDYGTVTTLNAVLSPRLSLNLTHSASVQPSGNFFYDATRGSDVFSPADRSKVFELRSDLSYTPTPGFSLTVAPTYSARERLGTIEGVSVPQRRSRTLTVDGGAVVNLSVAGRGRLEGNIGRRYLGDRTTGYDTNGVPDSGPLTETDFWRGTLTFSWQI